jgi:hypothetical protein
MSRSSTLFTLNRAEISLWPVLEGSITRTRPFGSPDSDNPIFLGWCAERIRCEHVLDEYKFWPTGARYEQIRHLNESHSINIGRLWLFGVEDAEQVAARSDYILVRSRLMFLRLGWVAEEPRPDSIEDQQWYSMLYVGVTAPNWNIASQDPIELNGEQSFRASYVKLKCGLGVLPDEHDPYTDEDLGS